MDAGINLGADCDDAVAAVLLPGYEFFIPNRTLGGKSYSFWTARCNYDPWLRPETSGGCMHESFPRTKDLIRQAFGAPSVGPFHGVSTGGIELNYTCWGRAGRI